MCCRKSECQLHAVRLSDFLALMFCKVLNMAHSQHVRLQAETDPLIRAFEEASEALKDGDDTAPRHAESTAARVLFCALA